MYRFHFKLTDMVMLHLIPIIEGSYINTIYLHNYEFKLVCVCVCVLCVSFVIQYPSLNQPKEVVTNLFFQFVRRMTLAHKLVVCTNYDYRLK